MSTLCQNKCEKKTVHNLRHFISVMLIAHRTDMTQAETSGGKKCQHCVKTNVRTRQFISSGILLGNSLDLNDLKIFLFYVCISFTKDCPILHIYF